MSRTTRPIGVAIGGDLLEQFDAWIAARHDYDPPSRSQEIRRAMRALMAAEPISENGLGE